VALSVAAMGACVLGCSGSSEHVSSVGQGLDVPLPSRPGTVVVDGCVVDPWQRSTLAGRGARRVLQEVVLLCLVPREDGTVGPRDKSARLKLAETVQDLRREGYRVHLGVAFTDESGQRYDGAQTATQIADPAWRARFVDTLPEAVGGADGVEIDLQLLPPQSRPAVTALVTATAAAMRPAKRLGVFVPPSVTSPSDLPGGEAFSRVELGALVDRLRVMTLDYSEGSPGPTIDPGWAVDAARLALGDVPDRVDIAYPLYGLDFGPRGLRPTTHADAIATATYSRSPIERGPTTAPFIRYQGFGGESHQLWFDDLESTSRALAAWNGDVLPLTMGVVFYGLGAEEASLFERLGERYGL